MGTWARYVDTAGFTFPGLSHEIGSDFDPMKHQIDKAIANPLPSGYLT